MLNDVERTYLLHIAATTIRDGVEQRAGASIDLDKLPEVLRAPGASFVTLHKLGQLRGCIGSLEPRQALAQDVADNAYSAAFRDPRFSPVQADELAALDLDISLLTPAQAMRFDSEQDLLQQLTPGQDGLILSAEGHRGTFLPSVWESLPKPADFLHHLKQKAGLPADYWSDEIVIERYGTEAFSAPFSTVEQAIDTYKG